MALQAFQRDQEGVQSILGEPSEVTVATVPGCEDLVDWMNCFRITQVCTSLSDMGRFSLTFHEL